MLDMEKNRNWYKTNIRRYSFTLNRTYDKDVLEQLEKQSNKRLYIMGLIRDDIAKQERHT